MSTVTDNFLRVTDRIAETAHRAGRDPRGVKLVAVSKTVELSRIREAVEAGVAILGENYVQEAQKKVVSLEKPVAWHFIGHLQSNKAKVAVQLFDMIHSLDSLSLAEELDRRAMQARRVIPVLAEVNLSKETTKFGLEQERLFSLVQGIQGLHHLSLAGLMTLPPLLGAPEESRPYFVELRKLKEKIVQSGIPMTELSMGMSGDFEVAIEEGATLVRIGTAIFGPRSNR